MIDLSFSQVIILLLFSGFFVIFLLFLQEVFIFLFPRKDQVKQNYPMETVLALSLDPGTQLDLILRYLRESWKTTQKKTTILRSAFIPTFVITSDVNNVQHILKDNFKNYGKSGNTFKPRLQGLLGDGIFNSDGHQWYAHRKTSAHLFKMNKFKGNILEVFNDDLNQLINVFKAKANTVIDIHDYLHRFTLESISRVAFGISLGCITNPEINFAKDFDYCTACINDSFLNPLWLFERYFTPKGWKYFAALSRINRYSNSIIQERRKEIARGDGKDKSDLLTLYLNQDTFQDVFTTSAADAPSQEALNAFMEPTDKNMRDVILNMVIAGRDTTAQALSWSFYHLCIHPEEQKKLRAEAKTVFAKCLKEGNTSNNEVSELDALTKDGGLGAVGYNTLQSLKYTEAFCMEVLRLHPSVPKEAKEVFEDDVLPDGTIIKKGELATFMPWCMGRDTDLWGKDAEEFHPERFLDPNAAKPSPFKFIAFQAGPRTCLGQNFALLEMKCVLSRLLLFFEFSLAQDPQSVTYDVSLTLPIKGGLKVKIMPI
jgi:cytochrome P450